MDAVVAAGIGSGASEKVVLFSGAFPACLPAVIVSAFGALDLGGETAGSLRVGSVLPALSRNLVPILLRPTVLMTCVRSAFPVDGAVLQEEIQRRSLRYFNVIDLLKKNTLVEFLQTEHFTAGFFQCLLGNDTFDRARCVGFLFLPNCQ